MTRSLSLSALVLALFLSACSGSTTTQQVSLEQSSSSAGVQIAVVQDAMGERNILVGESSSSSVLGIAGYQVQANQMFQSRYAGQSPTSSAHGGSINGSVQGSMSYDANGNVINTSGNFDANGNSINASGNTSGNSQASVSSSNRARSGNPSAYSYISGCDYSFLQRLGLEGQCGGTGWVFPGLVGGECPVTACMLSVERTEDSPFGPL